MTEAEDFLAHYGVKGMKWGVRKSPKVEVGKKPSKLLEYKKKQASDNSIAKSLTSTTGVTGIGLIKSKGNLSKAVAKKNQKTIDKIDRIQRGEGTARDVISIYGNVSLLDVYKSRR